MKMKKLMIAFTILCLVLSISGSALAVILSDAELYFDPTSAVFDYYDRIILDDLSSVNTYVWEASGDDIVDADVLPVLKPGTYPEEYSFSQDDYLQTPNLDYYADITDGTLTGTFTVSAQYMVRVTRESGSSQIYTLFAETGLLELPGHTNKSGPSRKISGPSGDLIIVAEGDSTLDRAYDNIVGEGKNVTSATGLAETIAKIKAASEAAGRKIHVELVGHGAPGMISMNDKSIADGDLVGPDAVDIQEFQDAIDEYVDNISLFSCESAKGPEGDQLLQILADSIGLASGWTVPITVEVGYFNVDYSKEAMSIPEPATLLLLGFGGLVLLRRRRGKAD